MEISKILDLDEKMLVTTRPDTMVADVIQTLTVEAIGAVVVKGDDGKLAGIISERDIVRGLHEHGANLLGMRVDELMTSSVISCAPESSVEDVMKQMTSNRIRHVPVVDDETLVGVISILDVVQSRLVEVESDYGTLRTFMATRIE